MSREYKQPSYNELMKRVRELKNLDPAKADISLIKDKLTEVFRGISIKTPVIMPGQILYRGVRVEGKPTNINRITYPQSETITTYQRANRPGNPMFYCSVSRESPFFELSMNENEFITISKWKVVKKIIVNQAGFHEDIFKQHGSVREHPKWSNNSDYSKGSKLVYNYFSKEFTKEVIEGDEHLYKISAAIAEKLYEGKIHDLHVSEGAYTGPNEFGGIIYPSLAMRASSDNLALKPSFINDHLNLEQLEYIY